MQMRDHVTPICRATWPFISMATITNSNKNSQRMDIEKLEFLEARTSSVTIMENE